MNEALGERLGRIYAAIGATIERDMSRLKATSLDTNEKHGFMQDFRGGLSDADLLNLALSAINNIAHLRGHLKKWAMDNNRDRHEIERAIRASLPLSIVVDLSDGDKHPGKKRDGGYSKKSPSITGINRVLRLRTGGSGIGMTLNADGTPRILGSGSAEAVLTADILDDANEKIADLDDMLELAVKAWEQLLDVWEIKLPA